MYDVNESECIKRVAQRMLADAKTEIYNSFMEKGYLYTSTTMKEAYLTNHSSMYALFPVWLITIKRKKKRYVLAMNGQTGKIVGNLPIDIWAVIRRFLAVFSAVFAIGMIITLAIWLFVL